MPPVVHLVGRFPPPFDGQSLATRRLARMLTGSYDVRTVDTALKDQSLTPRGIRPLAHTTQHYWSLRKSLKLSLAEAPGAPVLWGAISPTPLGHLRDMTATVPNFGKKQPIIAICHRGGFGRLFVSPQTRASAAWLAHRVDRWVFLSQHLASQVSPWVSKDRQSIIPYTVEPCATEDQIVTKRATRSEGDPLKLLYLSNMIRSKGYLDVLEAAGQLHVQGVQVSLVFAGRWNSEHDRIQFADRVRALGLDSVVTHHGALQAREAVDALHRDADVFLLPTYYSEEAQPISIIEALSAGTPVVVTRHAGIRDMVRADREARFVPKRSPSAIADAILTLQDDAAWQSASRDARRRYDGRFSETTVRKKWLGLLSKLV